MVMGGSCSEIRVLVVETDWWSLFTQGQRRMHNCSNIAFDLFAVAKESVRMLHLMP